MSESENNQIQFSAMIGGAVSQCLDEDSDFYVGELNDDNIKDFIHALGNMVPTLMHNRITGNAVSNIDFNHMANKMCFEFSNRVPKEDK